MNLDQIISGGQTGVDQAALQAAIDSGIDHGGWCPPGRICEEGVIPDRFKLKETPEEKSQEALDIPRSLRTEWNIRDAHASLIILPEGMPPDLGTSWAMKMTKKYHKPFLIIDPNNTDVEMVREWISINKIKILGVGGPSEKTYPGIYDLTYALMMKMLQ